MRHLQIFVGLLLLVALGCNSDPRCRRETALLRAEILDLEDKYYVTKAQRDDALTALQSQGKTDLVSKIAMRTPVSQDPECNEIYYGETLYEGSVSNAPPATVIQPSQPGTAAPYSSDIIYDDLQLPAQPAETSPIQNGVGQPRSDGASPRSPQSREIIPREKKSGVLQAPAEELPKGDEANGAPRNSSPRATPDANVGASSSPTRSQLPQLLKANQSTIRNADELPTNPVTEIVIERLQSVMLTDEFDSTSLRLLIKPRDASGNSRRASGSLTVSIVDPFSTTPEKPLGIWKFLPEEVELFFTDPNTEPGIELSLPLEEGLPKGKHVVVMVRLQTPDGRALETTSRIPNAKSKIKIDQGNEDLLAEGEKPSSPAWRPVRK